MPNPLRTADRSNGPGLADLVAALAARVDRLEALVEAGRWTRHDDPAADGRLLSAIAARVGSAVFTVRDLRHAAASDADLQAAVGGLDARRLGAWLKRLHRRGGCAPYVVERAGRDHAGALWCVSPLRHTHAGSPNRDAG